MATDSERQNAEKPDDFGDDPAGVVSRWKAEIQAYERGFKVWHERVPKIIKRYRDEEENEETEKLIRSHDRRFNILWSNVSTLQPALYSRQPKPEITRRWKDKSQVARAAAEILERAIAYQMDIYDFDGVIKGSRDDYLLAGRGTVWVRYVPTYGDETQDRIALTAGAQTPGNPASPTIYRQQDGGEVEEPEFGDDGEAFTLSEPYEPVLDETTECEFVNWRDFGHSSATTWAKVRAVWKREAMNRTQLIKRFGPKVGSAVPLNYKDKLAHLEEDSHETHKAVFSKALVYEIWDKETRKVIWICEDYPERPLDVKDDILGLRDFFPCPKPIYATTSTDSLVPVPDYIEYQSQANQLDVLTERIDLLLQALKVSGVYNGEYPEIERLVDSSAENTLVPVSEWAMFADKGGMKGAISFLPIDEISKVLVSLIEVRERIKQDLYEITGLSDIIRGQVDPREKLGQSRLKGQFASLRLRERQDEIARFVRDIIRIMAEITAEKFSPATLRSISGWDETSEAQVDQAEPQEDLFDEAVALLRNDKLRGYQIDIETDSTVMEDRQAEQAQRTEFLAQATTFLQQAVPAAQQYPALAPLLQEMLLFGIRSFRAGRHLEAVFEEAIEDMEGQPQQPLPADQEREAKRKLEEEKLTMEREKMERESANADADREMKRDIENRKIDIQKTQAEQPTAVAHAAQEMQQRLAAEQTETMQSLAAEQTEAMAVAQQGLVDRLEGMATQQTEAMAVALQGIAQTQNAMVQTAQMIAAALQSINAPRETRLVRDAEGRAVGAESRPVTMQ